MAGLRRRITAGFGANTLSQAVNIGIQFLAVPVYLLFWGAERYGEWLLLLAVPEYLRLVQLGYPVVATNDMAMRVGKNDHDGARVTFQSAIGTNLLLWSLLLPVLVAFIFLPLRDWLNLSLTAADQIVVILVILTFASFLSSMQSLLFAGYTCAGQYSRAVMTGTAIVLIETLSVLAVVSQTDTLVAAAVAIVCVRLAGLVWISRALPRHVPWIAISLQAFDRQRVRELFVPAISIASLQVSVTMRVHGIVLLIGATLGPAAVVGFTVLRTLSRVMVQAVNALNSALAPELSRYFGSGNMDVVRLLHHRAVGIAFWASVIAVAALILLGEWFIGVWTGDRIAFNAWVFHLLLVSAVCNTLWNTSSNFQRSTNRYQYIASLQIVTALLMLLGIYLALPDFGIESAALGLALLDLLLLAAILRHSLQHLDANFFQLMRVTLTPWRLLHMPSPNSRP